MFKPKTPISGRLEYSCGDRTRTCDLRVMSPTSCHCSTPRQELNVITATLIGQAPIQPSDKWVDIIQLEM